jgi:hypothetical protein
MPLFNTTPATGGMMCNENRATSHQNPILIKFGKPQYTVDQFS